MKKLSILFYTALALPLFCMLLLSSCDKMNDIQSKYEDKEETVYLGKVDSIKSYPGFGKTKLVWYISSDPKVERTIIYWNQRRDSVVKQFVRTTAGVQKDSVILEHLPEGSMLIEFRNTNNKGETSLLSSATATVWGPSFADGLRARSLTSFDYDYNQSRYNLALSKTTPGDSVIYSEITYTTKSNTINTVAINRGDTIAVLPDFPSGGTFQFRTIFFLPQGIDTVRNNYQAFSAPEAVTDRGTKIALKGNVNSKYFRFNDDLCEWNTSGDLIVYAVGANGELAEKSKYPALVSRTAFRDFFFYDGDRFIGIQTNNNVYMYQIVNGILTIVKTPAGVDNFGAGFTFLKYVPARGFFYSIAETTGEMKFWFALPNATWGTPNGTVVGTGFTYTPYALFDYQTLLGVDATGYLWTVPVMATGSIGSKSRMGLGWNRFAKIICVGTKLYGMEASGDFYVYSNFDATDKYWIVN
ncbi:DUF4998 domain-containing protein [Niabella sp. CC-SYL272]|uniref:DUF4998 domain-containing protein n=1 Tax=Niabella agricola TaxID=2891571 RepID=UPI001F3C2542|nr:DUF4998 domain-containing protein [Niabella agricola]MCF3108744.1 DUF4998 domain-containing protein [Niabella agricola]